jgi:extracellular elastinolytic metalloproteinase
MRHPASVAKPSTLVLAVLLACAGAAQAQVGLERRAAQVAQGLAGAPVAQGRGASAHAVLGEALAQRGRGAASVAATRLVKSRPGKGGLTHARFEQEVDGLPVYGAYAKAAYNAQGDLVHLIDNLANVPGQATAAAAQVSDKDALDTTMKKLYPTQQTNWRASSVRGNTSYFRDASGFLHRPAEVSAVMIPMADGGLDRGWLVETWTQRSNQLHHTLVSSDGRVLNIESRTSHDSYNIFPNDPLKGPQTVVSGPAPGGTESPQGWLGTGAQTTTNIVGNNVNAYLDADKNNRADRGGTAVASGNFLASANLTQAPSTTTNRAAAVQNLFYLNNRIHDILYRHGFDEAAGNFQTNNLGRGGVGGDAVMAEAQDGEGTDNANFATPPDGQRPRMQMFLWNPPFTHEVAVTGGATFNASGAAYGPALSTTGVTGPITRTSPADGCTAISTVLTGRVALIDRGGCEFTLKTLNAQARGATAVIIANNNTARPDETFSLAAGTNAKSARIGTVMVSLASGNALKALAAPSGTVRSKAVLPPQRDAAFDSDIVYHEYCHGLTWRMIGSMSGPMSGAIGEGMSDSCALLINGDEAGGDVVGEYSSSDPFGIRRYPYSNYPLRYNNLEGVSVHADGELYAAIVWKLMQDFGPARRSDLFTYLVQGMNFTPAAPRFENMRDGVLAAVQAAPVQPGDFCTVWSAFAFYGVGQGASGASFPPVASFTRGGGC